MSIGYKIKVKPEDFIVDEIHSLNIRDSGEYCVYRLAKRGWNTFDVIKRISKLYSIPPSKISYGGKKDRHAYTTQIITIKDRTKVIDHTDKNFSLSLLGYSDEPMGPSHIVANRFRIVVRNIAIGKESLLRRLDEIAKFGFINYFDDQRFGSYDKNQGFIAEKILKKHYKGAIKLYLTKIHPEDSKEEKERRKKLLSLWPNLNACIEQARTKIEKDILKSLIRYPDDPIRALRLIPKEEMSLFFSAFQGFLWNETVRRFILSRFENGQILIHRGIVSDYLFPVFELGNGFTKLEELTLPTASQRMQIKDPELSHIFESILSELGIRKSMFNLRDIRQAFFKSTERSLIVKPESFDFKILEDDLYVNKLKLELEFILPSGSYATMLVKRIFAHNYKKN